MTIIEALDNIQREVRGSKLSQEFWADCAPEFGYLKSRMNLTPFQIIFIAILAEHGDAMSWKQLGEYMGLSRLKIMSYTEEIDRLIDMRWAYMSCACDRFRHYDGFKLAPGMITTFRKNEVFVPEKIDNLSEQQFVDRLTTYVNEEGNDRDIRKSECNRWMMLLVKANMHLPLCQKVMALSEESSRIMLLLNVADYAYFHDTPDEGITLDALEDWFDEDCRFTPDSINLREGSHEVQLRNLFEFSCEDGLADNERYLLTSDAKEKLLGEYKPRTHKGRGRGKQYDRDLMKTTDITPKQLFYNEKVRRQLDRIRMLLSQDRLELVRERLEEAGLRKGVACLFYGSPGTGKTETVLQLARESGRDIMQVNIAAIRDKFVGESEKNIKGIFVRYRQLCKGKDIMPILLFNEADAIFGERFETTRSSVEKMDNSIQNIILQEMETLDGILIATTNLTGTLDKAFDRRFLFKVEFEKPDLQAKCAIWQQMMPGLGDADGLALASEFDFAGGEIENVTRKCKIETALTGMCPTLPQIREFCRSESLRSSSRSRIGF